MASVSLHRPRNVDWKRAAALLYGDWGTSKAYVIGFAFSASAAAAGYASFSIILAVCALTALVAYNYVVVCKHFPDGGGVYSAARDQSRFLAVMGALLLVANFTVTAAMSAWSAMNYFRISEGFIGLVACGIILLIGVINYFGPKHGGSVAISLAVPMVVVVVLIILLSLPHLTTDHFKPAPPSFSQNWLSFINLILALSGVEAIANLTGVMKLDPDSSMERPKVARTARKAIWPVAIEVVLGTSLLAWAMLSLSPDHEKLLRDQWEHMLSVLGEHYGTLTFGNAFGKAFGVFVGIVVGFLLLSAVNTAIAALIGLIYMLARDGEMPRNFTRLNSHGVPWFPLAIAIALPLLVVSFSSNLESLMGLYAIGVVGAITVNLGTCSFNKNLDLRWYERVVMGFTFLILFAVELTVAKTKPDALFFAVCILGFGFGLRAYAQRRAGLRTVTVSEEVAAHVAPESMADFRFNLTPGQTILVAARGVTPVLGFALEEARLRQGTLYVLYVKEVAVAIPGPVESMERPRWQDDARAASIMYPMLELGRQNNVTVIPLYAVSDNPAATILDLAATLGVDILMLGASHRRALTSLLKGNVVTEVARNLPENIQMLIHG
ncbi:MAG: universal stress protein [Verrucomicrobiota bacterium]|jgi:amino acid transporter/nucleotide-binding universal stress UspA family protein